MKMKLWLDIWRFEFYLGFHWYNYDKPWYKDIPRLLEVRDFDHCADVEIHPLFVCLTIGYNKRWNKKEGDESKFYWL